jgi:hypothetical protein
VVEVTEQHADGLASDGELETVLEQARHALEDAPWSQQPEPTESLRRRAAAAWAAFGVASGTVLSPSHFGADILAVLTRCCEAVGETHIEVKTAQAALLREIAGNPFREAVIDSAWLAWRDGTVHKIAQTIYADRSLDSLPILADALEEAGCEDANLLGHCRDQSGHARGCWVVDMMLGKVQAVEEQLSGLVSGV